MGSSTEQQARRGPSKGRAYKGVFYHKHSYRWMARIQVHSKKILLGYFDSKEDAARVYDCAARKHLGVRAYLNFPDLIEQAIDLEPKQHGFTWIPKKEMFKVWSRDPVTGFKRRWDWAHTESEASMTIRVLNEEPVEPEILVW